MIITRTRVVRSGMVKRLLLISQFWRSKGGLAASVIRLGLRDLIFQSLRVELDQHYLEQVVMKSCRFAVNCSEIVAVSS
jgi:hypothetical protein